MGNAQSSSIPSPGARPGLRDCGWLLVYGLRGLVELVRARLIFCRFAARDILVLNRYVATMAAQRSDRNPALTARIGYVIPRLSARLPWRSDCVIQAMAAQHWLAAHGLVSEIQIGVELPAEGLFGAHAWLVHDAEVVTGGVIGRYDRLVGDLPVTQDAQHTVVPCPPASPPKRVS